VPIRQTVKRTPTDKVRLQSPVEVTSNPNNPVYISSVPGGVDAFGRLRVSNPVTQLDYKQLYDELPLFYDDQETSGSGTSLTYNTNQASSTLAVSNLTAGTRVKQSKMRGFYQPGKGLLMYLTAVTGTCSTGITKRWGYFDDNNGLFFECAEGTLRVVRRTKTSGSPVDIAVDQANWNLDKLDGTGTSGKTLDITKSNIYGVDLEWLGVGGVRFFVVIDNQIIFCHQLYNANSLDVVYMSTPNLPIRYEITNDGTGGADSMDAICGSIISEGGNDDIIKPVVATRGTTSLAMNTTSGLYTPLVSIRLKSGQIGARINPEEVNAFVTTSNVDFHWKLILNPTIAGTDNASWTSIANSSIEYDISRDNTNTVTGGYELADGYGGTSNQVQSPVQGGNRSYLTLGSNVDGSVDEIVLAIAHCGTSGASTAYGSLRVGEYI